MEDTKARMPAERPSSAETGPAAERVLKALARLVNGRKIYADNNPRLEQFRQELESSLRQFFEFEDELVLTIEQYAMHCGDAVVYENLKRDESLAFILFKDGIGELTVAPGAIGGEINRLVDILADELFNVAGDEDVVTRFWNADFDHISYRVLDDYLAGEFGDGTGEARHAGRTEETADQAELLPSLADKGRVIVHRSESLESIDVLLRAVARRHHPELTGVEAELAYQRLLRSSFSVPVEELALYRREIESERAEDGVSAFLETMLVFTLLADNSSAVRDVTSVLERLVDYAVAEKHPGTLERMVRAIRAFVVQNELPDGVGKFCDRMLARAGNPALVASLLDTLTVSDAGADSVISYATAVGPGSVDGLLRALHRVESPSLHRKICDALVEVAGDSLATLLDRFDVDNPEVAIDAIHLAGTIGLDTLPPRLRELVFYPDARVKLEMLGLIAARDDAESTELLLTSLNDLDKRVRLRVLDALGDRPSPRVRERLTEIAFGRDLGERAPDEQEAVFRVLGHVGDARTVIHLRALVERRRLLSLGKGPDAKHLAIRALERIRDASALELLAKLAEDPNEAVRLRAQRAKESLASTLTGTAVRSERQP